MSGRFIVLYSLPSPAGVAGAPVVISKGDLLMDRISEKLFVRISTQSLDEREVHAVALRLQLFDEVGAPIDTIIDFRYNSLKAERDDEFGWNQLIPILNRNTRSFSTYINNVTFSDYSYWENTLPFQNFGKLQTLEEALGNKLLAKQFEAQYGSDCHYMPADETVIWYCACGAINRSDEERCHVCRRKMTALKDVNYEALKMEAKNHADIDKPEESSEDDNKKTKKDFKRLLFRTALILLPVLMVVALILSTVPPYLERQRTYKQAMFALNEMKYDEAQSIFHSLGNYQDANIQAEKEIPYQKALLLIKAAETADISAFSVAGIELPAAGEDDVSIRILLYKSAEELLEKIVPYKDSEEKLNEIHKAYEAYNEKRREEAYSDATALMQKGAYLQAEEAFLTIGDYRNSAEQAKECLYRRAVSILSFCENYNVRHIYLDISKNTDNKTRISMPGSVLTELGSDTVFELKKCFVEDGVEFFYEELPSGEGFLPICEAVQQEFKALGEYKDSQELMKKAEISGDFSQEFYLLLHEGELEEAERWLHKYGDEVPNADAYSEWLDYLQTLCDEWELSMGDSTLIPFSAGQEYTRLERFYTTITVDYNIATLHFVPEDESYEASLTANFGEKQFSGSPDGSIYYGYINQVERFVYIRYTQNGEVLSSCEYNRR